MMKNTLLFGMLLMSLAPRAKAATASDYYCHEMPLIAPIMFDGGEKSCTDAAGTKKVLAGKTCMETAKCYYLDIELKARIMAEVNIRMHMNFTDFARISDAQVKDFLEKHRADVEGETTVLMCDADTGISTGGAPTAVCKEPQLCKSDRFFGAKSVPLNIAFHDDVERRFQTNYQGNRAPVYPADVPADRQAPPTGDAGSTGATRASP